MDSDSQAKSPISASTLTDENVPSLDQRSLYFNRELSWLQFNRRVLEEAQNESNPLLERVKFLAIFANNLDEFFMIRVSGLLKQTEAGAFNGSPDGMAPADQLLMIRRELLIQLAEEDRCWQQGLLPQLRMAGIRILPYKELNRKQRLLLKHHFELEIFPTLTPLAFDPGHPFPHISNLSLNLAIIIHDPEHGEGFARLKIPDSTPRLITVHGEEPGDLDYKKHPVNDFVFIEDVITANLDMLFQSIEVKAAYAFRITRNADFEIEEDEASDLLASIQESVGMRRFGLAIRLEVDKTMPKTMRELLMNNLHLEPGQVYTIHKPIGMASFLELTKIERPDLKYPPLRPAAGSLNHGKNIFAVIRNHDLMLYHPYDSFAPVVDFLSEAARDPNVLAIKQTLYRVGANSPIVQALMEARENGKQVAALVELKARFDEENNIGWAQALERAGVHVVYGLLGLKTHAKICLVIRRESSGLNRYIHLSTGNYNVVTSRIYSDFSYFTCDPLIGADISDLFNALTGYSRKTEYHKIWVAPGMIRQRLIALIEREICRHRQHHDGYIAFKMNSLVDKDCIMALYQASQAGVKIDLQVRGICCLRPGIPGVSENIKVTSIVGRFLEHSRIYYFHNGGADDLFLGSADLMPRNLDRRIEILFPIADLHLKTILIRHVLSIHLNDNVKAQVLCADGHHEKITSGAEQPEINSQSWMLEHQGLFLGNESNNEAVYPLVAAMQDDTPPKEEGKA